MNILFGVFIIFTFFLLFISGILKSLSFDYFTFNTYEILNKKISKPIINISSIIFIFLELFIPLVSLLNFTIKKWQIILVAFSYLFTLLILLTAIYICLVISCKQNNTLRVILLILLISRWLNENNKKNFRYFFIYFSWYHRR